MVECQLPKLDGAGSNPVARSKEVNLRGLIKFVGTFGMLATLGYVSLSLFISGVAVLAAFLGILLVAVLLPSAAISGLAHLLSFTRSEVEIESDLRSEGRVCPRCGGPVDRKAVICERCFEDLATNCPHCGQIVRTGAKQCPRCGIRIPSNLTT